MSILHLKEVRSRINGLKNFVEELVQNQEQNEEYLRQIQQFTKQVRKTGLRTLPYFTLYVTKTQFIAKDWWIQ